MIGIVAGISAIPAVAGETPTTSRRKKGVRKPSPSSTMPARNWLTLAARKFWWRKSLKSIIGLAARRSTQRKIGMKSTPTTIGTSVCGSPQPASGPSLRPKIRAPMATAKVTTPGRSRSREASRSGSISGVARRVMRIAIAASGTLMRKTSRQSIAVSAPPRTGPRAAKKAEAPARIPSAVPFSSSG